MAPREKTPGRAYAMIQREEGPKGPVGSWPRRRRGPSRDLVRLAQAVRQEAKAVFGALASMYALPGVFSLSLGAFL